MESFFSVQIQNYFITIRNLVNCATNGLQMKKPR